MYIQNRRGMGDMTDDLLASATDTNTITGLPFLWEVGLGLLGTAFLLRWTGGVSKSYKRGRRKSLQTQARRAALKAELAAL
jgi:hypothetical protein